jgi:hypothetical protein
VTFLASIGTGVVWNGVPFIAKHDYGFSNTTTLWLYVMMGSTYVVGAFSTGRALRWFDRVVSPRTALAMILTAEAVVCSGPALVGEDWMLWLVAGMISILSSWLWPIIESYMTAGRHGRQMRNAIGWWNLSWTGAVGIALVAMAPLVEEHARLSIVVLGALHAVALVPLRWFARAPAAHDDALAEASVAPEYPFLLRAARLLLPLSYVLNSAMSPLLPYLMTRLELEAEAQTPVASVWMWVRIIAIAVMWRLGFWHGRWGTLLLGGAAMTAGFGLAVAGLSIGLMIAGLTLFGVGMGVIYYATLYYTMSVGRAEVEAGGAFEGLIGIGYTIGPATGLLGLAVSMQAQTLGYEVRDGAAVVAVVWLLIGLSAIGIAQPYRQARRSRKLAAR